MLRFHVRDRQNEGEAQQIRKQLSAMGLREAAAGQPCEVLAVHLNTDGPGKVGGISQEEADNVMARGGVYVEYSTGGASWRARSEGYVFGSHRELLARLRSIPSPVSLLALHQVLISLREEADGLPGEAPEGYDRILAVDTQGYPMEFMKYLEKRGYRVVQVTSCEEAEMVLEASPFPVVVCGPDVDYMGATGTRLMKFARNEAGCRLVVVVPAEPVAADAVPAAHAICAGYSAKRVAGARRLHAAICAWAEEH